MSREHKRVYLTAKQKTRKLNEQAWKCGCGCGEDLVKGNIAFDHKIPIWKRRKRKWSKQDEYNGQYALCEDPCHKRKTKKEAAERAHHDRLEKERMGKPKRKRAKAKIQSPGFPKNLTKGLDGKVRKRKKRKTKNALR